MALNLDDYDLLNKLGEIGLCLLVMAFRKAGYYEGCSAMMKCYNHSFLTPPPFRSKAKKMVCMSLAFEFAFFRTHYQIE